MRHDRRISDDEQLLVRMNDDQDVANALKLALADAPAYRVVSGFELSGAVIISCFTVADEIETQVDNRPLHRRLVSVRPSAINRRSARRSTMIGVEDLPQVVVDLTFTPVRGGQAVVRPGCWEEDRPPVVGEDLLVAECTDILTAVLHHQHVHDECTDEHQDCGDDGDPMHRAYMRQRQEFDGDEQRSEPSPSPTYSDSPQLIRWRKERVHLLGILESPPDVLQSVLIGVDVLTGELVFANAEDLLKCIGGISVSLTFPPRTSHADVQGLGGVTRFTLLRSMSFP